MRTDISCIGIAVVCGSFLACGGTTGGNGPGPSTDDAGGVTLNDAGPTGPSGNPDSGAAPDTAPPVDHGQPSSTYPAFPPDMGQLVNNGGLVLKSPVVVAVSWDSDPSQATFEQFADGIGASEYW